MGFKYAMILYDLNVWHKCVCTHALITNLVRHKGFSEKGRRVGRDSKAVGFIRMWAHGETIFKKSPLLSLKSMVLSEHPLARVMILQKMSTA